MSDAAKLREAIECCRFAIAGDGENSLSIVCDAAEKHLATLPKTKRVWFVIWRDCEGELRIGEYPASTNASQKAAWLQSIKATVIATVGPYEVPDDLP